MGNCMYPWKEYDVTFSAFVEEVFISAVKRVEFVSDRIVYILLRGRWCNIIVLSVHAPAEARVDYVKDSF
jgi:hypothetical protein